jgi:hypothetical protein
LPERPLRAKSAPEADADQQQEQRGSQAHRESSKEE